MIFFFFSADESKKVKIAKKSEVEESESKEAEDSGDENENADQNTENEKPVEKLPELGNFIFILYCYPG